MAKLSLYKEYMIKFILQATPSNMFPNLRRKYSIPVSCNIGRRYDKFHTFIAFSQLTICSASTIYRAYVHSDIPMIAFIIFVYFGNFVLNHCLTVYSKLPASDKSPKEKLLKSTIWVLSSAIMFGFACEFATFLSLAVSLSIFAVAIAGSSSLFYVYYIRDNRAGSSIWRSIGKMFRPSFPTRKAKKRHATSIWENV